MKIWPHVKVLCPFRLQKTNKYDVKTASLLRLVRPLVCVHQRHVYVDFLDVERGLYAMASNFISKADLVCVKLLLLLQTLYSSSHLVFHPANPGLCPIIYAASNAILNESNGSKIY